ncbi:MAG: CYTH domain-containing protein [Methylocystis sp.]
MATEIERKFLLEDGSWRAAAYKRELLVDGLVAASDGRKVRVRLYEDRATLTIKNSRDGLKRTEFEYEIPLADATELIAKHCGEKVLAKIRHYVEHMGFIWEIDEYVGLLEGVVIAEVELDSEDDHVPLPAWIGREITYDPDYRKINLLNACFGSLNRGEPARASFPPAA